MNSVAIWKTTLEKLELTLPPTDFNTFFHNTEITSLQVFDESAEVEIGTPHPFTSQRLEEKYQNLIKEYLESIVGKTVQLSISTQKTRDTSDHNSLGPIFANTMEKKQSTDKSNLNRNYTFETFVVGSNNQLASAVALSVAEQPGSYNPFFLYSQVGLGKTHLIHAIGNRIREMHSHLQVLYCPAETFMSSLVEAIRTRTQSQFKKTFRNVDVLLIDDVQLIAGKDSTQEELFNTFNSLYLLNKQLVFTSDRPPKDIQRLEERLRSRFAAGMITDMQSPDADVRMAILSSKESQYNHNLDPEVRELIALEVTANIRELEGAYKQIMTMEKTQNKTVLLEEAAKILKVNQTISSERSLITPQQIMKFTCDHFNITITELKGISRKKQYVLPRQISMYLMRYHTDLPLMGIGDLLGGRDHTTIIHGVETIKKKLSQGTDSTPQQIHQLKVRLGIQTY